MTGRRIAVIGGGISGLTAGYVLSRTDHVTLFEADRRLGGHADTHLVGPVPVDTGFIVYNERTYPLLTRLFAELGVTTRATEMSMSVRCAGCGLHYAGKRGPAGLAAGLRQGGGRFLRLLADVPRFHRAARDLLAGDAPRRGDAPGRDTHGSSPGDLTFGEFLIDGGLFRLLPGPLRAAAGRGGVVVPGRHGAALSRPVPVRLPGQPRDAVGVRARRPGAP